MNACAVKCGWHRILAVCKKLSVPSGSPAWSRRQRSRRPRCRSPRCCRLPRAPRRGRCGRSRPCRWTCRSEWRIWVSPPAPVCMSTWEAWAGRNTCRTLAGSGREGCIYPEPEHKRKRGFSQGDWRFSFFFCLFQQATLFNWQKTVNAATEMLTFPSQNHILSYICSHFCFKHKRSNWIRPDVSAVVMH